MNYLAHMYLSGNDRDLLFGNYIADGLKGSAVKGYSDGIRNGITLHRFIDEFTDKHPVVIQSKVRLRVKYRKYAPVIVDIFYDHFLSKNWHEFHHQKLEEYSEEVYTYLQKRLDIMPIHSQMFLNYMITRNALLNYKDIYFIERVLKGMTSRSKFNNNMFESVGELKDNYEAFESEFTSFFIDLRLEVEKFIANDFARIGSY